PASGSPDAGEFDGADPRLRAGRRHRGRDRGVAAARVRDVRGDAGLLGPRALGRATTRATVGADAAFPERAPKRGTEGGEGTTRGANPKAWGLVCPMGTQVPTVDQAVAQIAGGQHGVVTRSELLRAGLTVTQIARRVRRGGLISQFRGVYRVGHAAPSVAARYMAAVLAAGNGAVVSGNA